MGSNRSGARAKQKERRRRRDENRMLKKLAAQKDKAAPVKSER